MTYKLLITADDIQTIRFVGYRYGWSDALTKHINEEESCIEMEEHEAWEWAEAYDEDMEGGHSPLPMLDPTSDLYRHLTELREEIV